MKKCKTCQVEKPLTEFPHKRVYKKRSEEFKLSYVSNCKPCTYKRYSKPKDPEKVATARRFVSEI